MVESNSDRNPVEQLAEEFLARIRDGQHPSLTEYVQRLPQHAEEIRELFPMLLEIEHAADGEDSATTMAEHIDHPEQIGDYRIVREIGRGGMGVVYEAVQQSLGRHVALKVLPAKTYPDELALQRFRREATAAANLHHTNIVPVFDVGQQDGISYYAMQFIQGQSFDKVVQDLRKQVSEGDGAPRLPSHFSAHLIAHGPSTQRTRQTLATNYATASESTQVGASIPAALDDSSTSTSHDPPGSISPLPIDSSTEIAFREYCRSVAIVGHQVAQALAYAHGRGVVHRDIKPANLLLDANSVVWLTDFGMAKIDAEPLTRTGDILGTIHYMAPERFQGECDERADIYAAGLTIYELLTLTPAFQSSDRLQLMELITRQEPVQPRSLNPQIPRDLETIVLKAVEKDPKARYQSAADLADDLQCFLDDRPIQARKVSVAERFIRWSRRNPMLSGLSMTVVLGLLLAFVGATVTAIVLKASQDRAVKAERLSQERLAQLNQQDYINRVNLAYLECRNDNVASAAEHLAECPPEGRGWEWQFVASQCEKALRSIKEPGHSVNCLDFSPGGNWIAIGTGNFLNRSGPPGDLVVRDVWTGEAKFTKQGLENGVTAVVFSPDESKIASANGNTLTVWNAHTGASLFRVQGAEEDLLCLEFSPDGHRIAGGFGRFNSSRAGYVQLWDATTGEATSERINGHAGGVWDLAFDPSGSRLAMTNEHYVEVWDLESNQSIARLEANTGFLYCVAFHPQGRYVAAGGLDRAIRLWDLETGEVLRTYTGHTGFVRSLAFSPGGQRMISASEDKSVRLWDIGAERELTTLRGHAHFVNCVSFRDDGLIVASGSLDQSVKIWFATADPQLIYRGHREEGHVRALAFSPRGDAIATGSLRFPGPLGRLHLWDPRTGRRLVEFPQNVEEVASIDFRNDGQQLAAGHVSGMVTIWNAKTAELLHRLDVHIREVSDVQYSPDGTLLATVGEDRGLHVWDPEAGTKIYTAMGHEGVVTSVEFAPDGKTIATSSEDGTVRLWVTETGRPLSVVRHDGGEVRSVAFSPNGRLLVSTGGIDHRRGDVLVWDARTSRRIANLSGHTDIVYDVDFSSDGKRFVTASDDRTIKLWDAESDWKPEISKEVFTIRGHTGGVVSVEFSPDDQQLASGSVDRTVRLWSLKPTGIQTHFDREAVAAHENGRSLLAQRDWRAALSAFQRAAELGLDQPDFHFDLATALEQVAHPEVNAEQEMVVEHLDKAVDGTSDVEHDLVSLSLRLLQNGHGEHATSVLGRAMQAAPDGLRVLSAAGRVHAALGQVDTAHQAFQRAVDQKKKTAGTASWWWETGWWVANANGFDLGEQDLPDKIVSPVQGLLNDSAKGPQDDTRPWMTPVEEGDGYLDFQNKKQTVSPSVYATQHIYASKDQQVAFLVGGSDAMHVWLNGQLAYTQTNGGEDRMAQEAILVSLQSGWNTVVVKLDNRREPHGMYFQTSSHARDLVRGANRIGRLDEILKFWSSASPSELKDVRLLSIVADTCAQHGRWNEAADAYGRLVEQQPVEYSNWISLAPLLVHTGRLERYRDFRHDLLAHFGNAQTSVTAERTAKASLLIPVSAEDAVQPHQLASYAAEVGATHNLAPYFIFAKGMADYRIGDFSAALKALEEARVGNRSRWPYLDVVIHLFLAMSHGQLDNHEAADRHFQMADEIFTRQLPSADSGEFGPAWLDWVICSIARNEAQELLSAKTKL